MMLANQIDSSWRDVTIQTNGVELHLVEAGPRDGPLVILLHGFPEFWYAWKDQINPLAAAGYRVLVPDQRGYNLSARPAGASAYSAEKISRDIVGLIDSVGREKAMLVAHDWGGHMAWWTAARHPERVERLVVLNCGHPNVMLRNVLLNPRQTFKSWYVIALQVPWIPEWILSRHRFAILRRGIRWDGDVGPLSADDEQRYIEAWSQPRAFTSMINWYRAPLRTLPWTLSSATARIRMPMLLIWGAQDRFLDRSLVDQSLAYCDDGRVRYFPDATHWVHHEKPAAVQALIGDFLAGRA
jgi:epoxide hydrolase 4